MRKSDEPAPPPYSLTEAIELVRQFLDVIESALKQFEDKEVDQAIYISQQDGHERDLASTFAILSSRTLQAKLQRLLDGVERAINAKGSAGPFISIKEQGKIFAQQEAGVRDRRNARRRQRRKDARELRELRRFKAAFDAQKDETQHSQLLEGEKTRGPQTQQEG